MKEENVIRQLSVELENIRNGKQMLSFDGSKFTAQQVVVENDICKQYLFQY